MDRGKPGTKRHLATDRKGIPLAFLLTPANMHDSVVFEELIDSIGPIKRPRGRPRKRPEKLHADKAYDNRRCRSALTRRRIKVRIARKGVESSKRLRRCTGAFASATSEGTKSGKRGIISPRPSSACVNSHEWF